MAIPIKRNGVIVLFERGSDSAGRRIYHAIEFVCFAEVHSLFVAGVLSSDMDCFICNGTLYAATKEGFEQAMADV